MLPTIINGRIYFNNIPRTQLTMCTEESHFDSMGYNITLSRGFAHDVTGADHRHICHVGSILQYYCDRDHLFFFSFFHNMHSFQAKDATSQLTANLNIDTRGIFLPCPGPQPKSTKKVKNMQNFLSVDAGISRPLTYLHFRRYFKCIFNSPLQNSS